MLQLKMPLRAATLDDAKILADLINLASEGISYYLWSLDAAPDQDPWEIGRERAVRETGGFSYRNAVLYEVEGLPVGMLLGYKLPDIIANDDLAGVPDFVVPLLELEALASGSWYINGLAVLPGYEGHGIASHLLALADEMAGNSGARETSLIVADENDRAHSLYEYKGYQQRASKPVISHAGAPHKGHWVLMVKSIMS
jgi:ribosomal protein S18 acetylase RimI-like enzyme